MDADTVRVLMRTWQQAREPFVSFVAAVAVVSVAVVSAPKIDELPIADFASVEGFPDIPPEPAEQPVPEEVEAPPDNAVPWLEYRIRRGDTMGSILKNIGADNEALNFFVTKKFKTYRKLRRGDRLQFRMDDNNRLLELRYKTSPEYYFHAEVDDTGQWHAEEAPPETTSVTRHTGGLIESSLFAAADKAGFSDSAIQQLIEAMETQVDFYRDVRENDSFRAIYTENMDEDGVPIGEAKLLAFEYTNLLNPSKPRVIRGARNDDNGGYYSEEGESLQGAFLRSPLKFRRISSKFSLRRFHPVLKKWRPHRGVDYAAPTGTPVRVTADGTISLVANQRGYGKVIMVKHFGIYTTVYAHLSRFAKGARRGRKVQQGQVIGYVGQTGLSTGPHLHYEFRVRGKHIDPLSASVPKVKPPLKGDTLKEFKLAATPLLAQLGDIEIQ